MKTSKEQGGNSIMAWVRRLCTGVCSQGSTCKSNTVKAITFAMICDKIMPGVRRLCMVVCGQGSMSL